MWESLSSRSWTSGLRTLVSSHGLSKTPLAFWERGLIHGSRTAVIQRNWCFHEIFFLWKRCFSFPKLVLVETALKTGAVLRTQGTDMELTPVSDAQVYIHAACLICLYNSIQ